MHGKLGNNTARRGQSAIFIEQIFSTAYQLGAANQQLRKFFYCQIQPLYPDTYTPVPS
jgi:hypothetical protein